MTRNRLISSLVALTMLSADRSGASDPADDGHPDVANVGEHDYPMWGGNRARVNAPNGKAIPMDWDFGDLYEDSRRTGYNPAWKNGQRPRGAKNIKWVVRLGTQTYGNPSVANGRVFVGTNNGAGYLDRYPPSVDLGVLLCFDEQTAEFLWQHSNEKLPSGRVHDWPLQGVCSTPVVDGDRLWYVTNRGEVVCLDTEGFHDGEDDGPEIGTWVPLFDVSMSYRDALDKSQNLRLVRRLINAFRKADIQVHDQLWIRQIVRGERWLIGRWRRTREGSEWTSSYALRMRDGNLLIYRTTDDAEGGRDSQHPLITLPDELLHSGLDQGRINASLHQAFEAYGVRLARDCAIQTTLRDTAWLLTDMAEDTERTFRLRLNPQQQISAEMLLTPANKREADMVWKFDMIKELGVSPHNMSNCSPLIVGNKLFICTSNGLDESHVHLPKPDAPSFLAMDRETGQVLWSSSLPGKNILHAQWASPSYAVFRGQPQVIFPGGDGWVYSFDPDGDGRGGAKLLWKFDGNWKTSQWILGGRGTRNNIIAFPAIHDGLVYITMGQDPEHGEGAGLLWCIDPTRRMDGGDVSAELAVDEAGNVLAHRRVQAVDPSRGERAIPNPNSAVVWSYAESDQNADGTIDFEERFHRSLGIPAIKGDILYVPDFSGLFHCLDAKTGKVHWTYDMFAACWGSALVVDRKVYIGDEDGDVSVFRHSADPNVAMKDGEPIHVVEMRNSVYMTPIVANNVLYIANKTTLFAIAGDGTNADLPLE